MALVQMLRLSMQQSIQHQSLRSPTSYSRSIRPFSQSSIPRYPRKGSEDKDSINTEATEYSKSGSDDAAARLEEAAFDPDNTDPDREREIAGKESEKSGNPLDVSPANPEVSKPSGGPEKSSGERKRSEGGSTPNP